MGPGGVRGDRSGFSRSALATALAGCLERLPGFSRIPGSSRTFLIVRFDVESGPGKTIDLIHEGTPCPGPVIPVVMLNQPSPFGDARRGPGRYDVNDVKYNHVCV